MGDTLTKCQYCGSYELAAVKVTTMVRKQRGEGFWGPEFIARESYLLMCESCGAENTEVNKKPVIPGWDFPKITEIHRPKPEPEPFMAVGANDLAEPFKIGDWAVCPACGKHHEVHGAIDAKTKKPSNMILYVKCGDKQYVVGIAGKRLVK